MYPRRMSCPVRAEIRAEVRYIETDQMGMVHHANYLVWFELARTRLCELGGRHYADIERLGYRLVTSGANLRYRGPARYGETCSVTCWIEKMESRRLRFAYEIRRRDTVLVTGTTDHVWVDVERQRPCRIPAEVVDAFRELAGGTDGAGSG